MTALLAHSFFYWQLKCCLFLFKPYLRFYKIILPYTCHIIYFRISVFIHFIIYKNNAALFVIMLLKDYYKILELKPGAPVADIKKSFRRLALLYHPDKNFGSKVYEAKFKEIKEAYEILSDIRQRQEYNSRRREQSQTEKKDTYRQPDAQTLLNQAAEFRKKITALDPERMNKRAVYHHIQHLLVIQNILILKHTNDLRISRTFIDEILTCSRFLRFPQVEKICVQLAQLAGTDNETFKKIYQFSRQSRIETYWGKYKFAVAVIVAVLLCLLIYVLSTNF